MSDRHRFFVRLVRGALLGPRPRRGLPDLRLWCAAHAFENVLEIALGVDIQRLAGGDDGEKTRSNPPALLASEESTRGTSPRGRSQNRK